MTDGTRSGLRKQVIRWGFGARSLAAWLAVRSPTPVEHREALAQGGGPAVKALTRGRLGWYTSRRGTV